LILPLFNGVNILKKINSKGLRHALPWGNNRQDIFHDNDDRIYYLRWARKLAEKYSVEAIRTAAQQGKARGRAGFLEKLADFLDRIVVPRKRGRSKEENK
jgi:hypothetical protein